MGSRSQIKDFCTVISKEYRFIFKDEGVVLLLVFAIVIYATFYSLAYSNEVLRDIPIAVVDNSKTEASRSLIENVNATSNVIISYSASGMNEAKQLFFEREVYGILYVPHDYHTNIILGEVTTVGLYSDASYFLMYHQIFEAVSNVVMSVGDGIRTEYLSELEVDVDVVSEPIVYNSTNLFNPYLGYGTFIMPAILILLIQQTLIFGIGMIGGTWREFGLYERFSVLSVVLGKATVYISIYAITLLYVLGVHYKMFEYPMNGSLPSVVIFLLPYLLSSIFLAITISTFFRKREDSMLYLLWTSIPLLLLSGASMPVEAIPDWMYSIGKIFPSGNAIEGYVRIQSMGATLSDVMSQYKVLWILTIVYFITACISVKIVLRTKTSK